MVVKTTKGNLYFPAADEMQRAMEENVRKIQGLEKAVKACAEALKAFKEKVAASR